MDGEIETKKKLKKVLICAHYAPSPLRPFCMSCWGSSVDHKIKIIVMTHLTKQKTETMTPTAAATAKQVKSPRNEKRIIMSLGLFIVYEGWKTYRS